MAGNNANSDSVTTHRQNYPGSRIPAKNLVDAISEIQIMNVAEASGSEIDGNYFTWQMSIEFFAVGFKSFVAGFILCLFLVPLAVAAAHYPIPVYGGTPNLYDKIFMFVLSFSVSFGAAAILLSSSKYVRGITTYQMVKSLYTGAIASALIKGTILFFIFQVMAALITPNFLVNHMRNILLLFPAYKQDFGDNAFLAASNLAAAIKPVFRISAMITALFSIVVCICLIIKWMIMRKNYLNFKYIQSYTENGENGN